MKTNLMGLHSFYLEALGTFILVFVYGVTSNALAIGLSLMALVYISRNISGAHFNPAVSFGFFLFRKLSFKEFSGYIISQLLGGLLAAISLSLIAGSVFYLDPPSNTNIYQQAFTEVLFTFLFVLVMLVFAYGSSFKSNPVYGFAIGLTFTGILIAGTPISGGVFNPAISIGTAAFDLFGGGTSYIHAILYTIAPLTGGALAAFIYRFLIKPAEE